MRCPNCLQESIVKLVDKTNDIVLYTCSEVGGICENYEDLINFKWQEQDSYFNNKGFDYSKFEYIDPSDESDSLPSLIEAVYKNDFNEVKRIIEHSKDLIVTNVYKKTALHYAAYRDIEITKFLLDNGAKIDAIDETGETPIFDAIYNYSLSMVELFIKNGSKVNIQNIYGQTPLHLAVRLLEESIPLLLENGADVNIRDNLKNTPLDLAYKFMNNDLDEGKILSLEKTIYLLKKYKNKG